MPVDAKLVLGIIGNATAMALFLSPTPTFLRIVKKKSTQEYSGLPYICTLFNCLMWVLYGMPFVKPHSILIITINGFGTILELLYLSLFLAFTTKKRKMQMTRYLAGIVTVYVAIFVITMFALHTLALRQLVIGSLCVILNTAMYASPLSIMGLVIHTKSVEFMPFMLSLCNFANSAMWTSYALVTKDIFVGIPNGLGCLCAILQLVLYGIYCRHTPLSTKLENGELGKEGYSKENLNISMEHKSLEQDTGTYKTKEMSTITSKQGSKFFSLPRSLNQQPSMTLSDRNALIAQV